MNHNEAAFVSHNGAKFWKDEQVLYYPEGSTQPFMAKITAFSSEPKKAHITYDAPEGNVFLAADLSSLEKLEDSYSLALNPGLLPEILLPEKTPIMSSDELDQKAYELYKKLTCADHVVIREDNGKWDHTWTGFGKTGKVTGINRSKEQFSFKVVGTNEELVAHSIQIFEILQNSPETKTSPPIYKAGEIAFLDKTWVPPGINCNLIKIESYNDEVDLYTINFIAPGFVDDNTKQLITDMMVSRDLVRKTQDGGADMNYVPTKSSTTPTKTTTTGTSSLIEAFFKVYGQDTVYSTKFWKDEMENAMQKVSYEVQLINGVQTPIFIIKPEHAAWKKDSSKNPLMCAFDATTKYLESIMGVKLSAQDDAAWYKAHPLITSNGLPQQNTITVLNDLVKPYGFGVKKVFCRKGTSAFEETIKWQKVLGINPIALDTRNQSNQEFLESLPEEARSMFNDSDWAFEYVDELPSIPLVVMNGASGTTTWATGLGHASYSSPRAYKGNGWHIALTYDRIENCNRFETPPDTDDMVDNTLVLDISSSKDDKGNTIRQSVERSYSQSWQGSNRSHSGYKPSEGGAQSGTPFQKTMAAIQKEELANGSGNNPNINSALKFSNNDVRKFKDAGVIRSSKKGNHPVMQGFIQFLRVLGLKKTDSTLTAEDFLYSKETLRRIAKTFEEEFCNSNFQYPYPGVTSVKGDREYLSDFALPIKESGSSAHLNYVEGDALFQEKLAKFLTFLICECGYLNTYAFFCAIHQGVNLVELDSTKGISIPFTDIHYSLFLNDLWLELTICYL